MRYLLTHPHPIQEELRYTGLQVYSPFLFRFSSGAKDEYAKMFEQRTGRILLFVKIFEEGDSFHFHYTPPYLYPLPNLFVY